MISTLPMLKSCVYASHQSRGPNMENTIAIYKLIILYLLDHAAGEGENGMASDGEISMGRISNFLIENAYVDFKMLLSTYSQIEKDGYLIGRTVGDTMFLHITDEGRAAVRMFKAQLSPEIRERADAYLKENGRQLREERQVTAEYYRASYGGYTVRMAVREEQKMLFELNLNVPDEDTARHVAGRFRKESANIYGTVIDQLFQ